MIVCIFACGRDRYKLHLYHEKFVNGDQASLFLLKVLWNVKLPIFLESVFFYVVQHWWKLQFDLNVFFEFDQEYSILHKLWNNQLLISLGNVFFFLHLAWCKYKYSWKLQFQYIIFVKWWCVTTRLAKIFLKLAKCQYLQKGSMHVFFFSL